MSANSINKIQKNNIKKRSYRMGGGANGAVGGWKALAGDGRIFFIIVVIANKLVGHGMGKALGNGILLAIEVGNAKGARADMAVHQGHHR